MITNIVYNNELPTFIYSSLMYKIKKNLVQSVHHFNTISY